MEMKGHGMASNLREYVLESMHDERRKFITTESLDSVKLGNHFFFLKRLKVINI